jgi:hypothetical protein
MLDKLPPVWSHRIAQLLRTPPAVEYLLAARDPRRDQTRRLLALLRANQDTEFGRAHRFSEIKGFDDLRKNVPLMSAATLRPWVERLQRGDKNLLTAEEPIFFARSSGTSGAPKEIPIHDTYRADFQRSVMVGLWFCFWNTPEAFQHKLLYLVAPGCLDHTPTGLEIGNISGYNFNRMPAQVRAIYAWPYELVELQDMDTRTYLSWHIAIQERVSLIAGIFPVGVLFLLRGLDTYAAELSHHTAHGTLPDWLVMTDAQRTFFSRYLVSDAALSARMAACAAAPSDQRVALALPDLRAIYCWRASTASLYIPEIEERVGPDVRVLDTIYSATEGWCSIVLGEQEDGGPIALTSHVYEFIDEALVDDTDLKIEALRDVPTLLVDELEDGKRYYIILTTSAGLYRYLLGDIVEVCGMWRGLPRLKFVRKYGASYNLTGEKLEESHVTDAVAWALAQQGRRAVWFAMMPAFGQEPHYKLYVEFADDDVDPARLRDFAALVNQHLIKINVGWEDEIVSKTLGPIDPRQVRPGAYAAQLARWEAQGKPTGQLKATHLITDPARLPIDPLTDLGGT